MQSIFYIDMELMIATFLSLIFIVKLHKNKVSTKTIHSNKMLSEFTQPSCQKIPKSASNNDIPFIRKSISMTLNDNEKWLDVLDKGYFLCDKILL